MNPAQKQARPNRRRFLSLMTVLCLLLIGVVAPPPAQANDAYGTLELAGSNWWGGNGVNVYSNGDYAYASGVYNYVTVNGQRVKVGMEWQCVELAQRFYTVQGWHSGLFPGVTGAADIWTVAAGMGMTTQANGSITSIVPGDMIIHGTGDKFSPTYGHVAIADHMSTDGKTVYAVQQNAPATITYGLSWDASGKGTLTGGTGTDIKGIVHSPNNTNTSSAPPPSPYKQSYAAAATNTDGTIELFAVGTDKNIYVERQSAPSTDSWNGWYGINAGANSVAASRNADGRLEVFYVGNDGAVWYRYQLAASSDNWSGEERIAASLAGPISASVNANGTLQIFAVGTDKNIYVTQQTAANADSWTSWGELNAGALSVTSSVNADGRQEVFYKGSDGAVYYRYRATANSGNWSNEERIAGNLNGQLTASSNTDGTIELFAVGTDKNIYAERQSTPNADSWNGWYGINAGANSLASTANADGRLQEFTIGDDGALYYRYQLAASSDNWSNEERIAGNLMR